MSVYMSILNTQTQKLVDYFRQNLKGDVYTLIFKFLRCVGVCVAHLNLVFCSRSLIIVIKAINLLAQWQFYVF